MVRSGPRIGFVVSGVVGNAVTRNRVKRRLRHLATAQVADTPVELARRIDIVVRALPRAATVPEEVQEDFGSAWYEVVSRLSTGRPAENGGAR
jgi:ribonuclease P protein component